MDFATKNLDSIFRGKTLDEVLQQDKARCDDLDINVMWYHGKMQRNNAESILQEAMRLNPTTDSDGLFLVRDSTASEVDFSLSFLFESKCYHFYIQRSKEGYFFIEGGPIVHGLEQLIDHYVQSANRLPTRLSKICKGTLPPAKVRKLGPTNLLHRAVAERREDIVKKILGHPLQPDIDAKNDSGSTALHDAVTLGLDKTVRLLLNQGANIKIKDVNGDTPLHKACEVNRASAVVLLITHDNTCMQERSPQTGYVALHTAAMHGHTECANVLLNAGAALYSRNTNEETPIELAEKFRRTECVELFTSFKEHPVDTQKSDWFHPELDRQGAENVFNSQPLTSGLFLIRPNKNMEGQYVLSLVKDKSVYHYEIKTKEYRNSIVHYIDDGPLHLSLELLVQYYHNFEDGLGVPLRASISTNNKVKELIIQEVYSNLVSPRSPSINPLSHPNAYKPRLPPRPQELESPPPMESPPLPPTPSIAEDKDDSKKITVKKEEEKEELKKISPKNIKLGNELGKGEYGSVMKGELIMEKKFLKKDKIPVAIKTFHAVGSMEDFKAEAYVMQSLKNDYIVQLLGVCEGPPLMLVEEFVPMGSMLDYLEDHPEKVRVKQELYLWAAQIAQGMMYLETKRLVHRDLAARNILLHSLQKVKISDFGLSRAMGTDKEYYKATKGGRWPIKWYAPESVNFGHFSHASDVWSYGVTLWEMFSYGGAPFEDMTGVEVIKFIEDGNRLDKPEKCPTVVYDIMLRCWSAEPVSRPTFTWLNKHFEEEPEYMSTRELMRTARTQ
ncbi:tyrosine-protein kinase HTK16-like [Physella acuta]|uniref:tyrosine-protein kinase HTK16-like n=1 Tax=Physella acuta TaxID=109671 RepID=UPI0027DD428A|nr:tyrosine-protein kinase HTK16-like [Physella acuta]